MVLTIGYDGLHQRMFDSLSTDRTEYIHASFKTNLAKQNDRMFKTQMNNVSEYLRYLIVHTGINSDEMVDRQNIISNLEKYDISKVLLETPAGRRNEVYGQDLIFFLKILTTFALTVATYLMLVTNRY